LTGKEAPVSTLLGGNLRRLRTAKGYTQKAVADAARISVAAYRNYETGRAIPKVNTLLAIARAIGVSLNDLVTEARPLTAVRFRAAKRLRSREEVLDDVARWLDNYIDIEAITGETADWKLQELVGRHDPITAASEVRRVAGIGDEPVRDVCGLLEYLGVKVLCRPVCTDGFFGLSVGPADGGPAIVVNTWERIPVERWIFSAVHELGHLVLHPDSFRVEQADEIAQEEKEADRFAAHFLMPSAVFKQEWDDTCGLPLIDRVLKVKRIFRVSYKTVLYRLAEEGDRSVWQRFNAQYARHYGRRARHSEPLPLGPEEYQPVENRRSKEPEQLVDVDFTADRLSRLVRRALEEERITRSRAAEVLRLSHEELLERMEDWAA